VSLMTIIMTQHILICYQLYKNSIILSNLRGSDLGRQTLHNHGIIKYAGFVMNMEYPIPCLIPRKYIKQKSMVKSLQIQQSLSHSTNSPTCVGTKGSLLWGWCSWAGPQVHCHLQTANCCINSTPNTPTFPATVL
jgi:hypothetical protein